MDINLYKTKFGKQLFSYIKDYWQYIVFFVLLLLLHIFMVCRGDDIDFQNYLKHKPFFDFLIYRYSTWSSRFIIEACLTFITKSMALWAILDTLLTTVGMYYLIKLVNRNNNKNIIFYGLLLFLMYPLFDVSSSGWMATTLNYSWCFALGMISFIPLIKQSYDEKTNIFFYVLAIVGLLYATNQEQACLLIFGFNLLYLINTFIKKEKINKYNLFALTISLLALIIILICPGNDARFAQELLYRYPEFAGYGLLQKIYLGTIPTFGCLLKDKLIFSIFYVLLNLTLLCNIKNKNLKYILCFNIIFILLLTIFKPILVHSFPGFKQPLDLLLFKGIPQNQIKATLVAIAICVYLFVSSCLMLYKCYNKKLFPLILFIAGFMSRFILGFSPTIFASRFRTMFFFYMILIALILMLIHKLYNENVINEKREFLMKIIFFVLALFNYINVFILLNSILVH